MKKIYIVPSLLALGMLLQSGAKYSTVPPAGLTGATGAYCTGCHSGTAVNGGGGTISVNGLPATGYVPGQSYPFSITITHSAANRSRWGFSIAARNAGGTAVGTFTTTNPNAAVNSGTTATNQELSHTNAVTQAGATYTYNNLVWTAPATPPAGNNNVTFYYTGNAANGNGSPAGDFIYAGSTTIALPIELKNFSASVINNRSVALQWRTSSEANSDYFEVEKSDDNQFFYSLGRITAAGNASTEKSYSFTDATITTLNKPVFYRLRLVDKDGKFKLSNVVSVKLNGNKNFVENVYPTIVNTNMLVTAEIVSDKTQPVQIQLIDANGRLLKLIKDQLVSGNNVVGIRMPNALPQQWVYARFTIGNVHQTIPLVVHP